ncbi:MAG: winged helix-turn-helix transcriptional regulator [Anaerolineales bacterium]|nr:winged helix-turn-helix transcriptional regulator [Anaerolineales bacterium]
MVKSSKNYDLEILNHIEENPDTTQADLAIQLGVAVGSVNWYLKRLINKGYIKVTQMQRRRLRYLLTPKGLAEKAHLTTSFMQASLHWYRETRESSKRLLQEVQQAGYDTVCIEGDGDLAEIIYLTCLEAHIKVKRPVDPAYPVFKIEGLQTRLDWPGTTLSSSTGFKETLE